MVNDHVKKRTRGLWWRSTSVCSNAALQVGSALPLCPQYRETLWVNVWRKTEGQLMLRHTRVITTWRTQKRKRSKIKYKEVENIYLLGRECNLICFKLRQLSSTGKFGKALTSLFLIRQQTTILHFFLKDYTRNATVWRQNRAWLWQKVAKSTYQHV